METVLEEFRRFNIEKISIDSFTQRPGINKSKATAKIRTRRLTNILGRKTIIKYIISIHKVWKALRIKMPIKNKSQTTSAIRKRDNSNNPRNFGIWFILRPPFYLHDLRSTAIHSVSLGTNSDIYTTSSSFA